VSRSRRTNVFVLSNYVVYRQLGKKPVDVSVYLKNIVPISGRVDSEQSTLLNLESLVT
jgi:hypothetical protein